MAKVGVCIEPFFTDLPYAQRLERVAGLGFKYYEFWFHDKRFDGKALLDEERDLDGLAELNARLGLTCTDFVFNHPDGGVVAAMIERKDRSRLLDSLEGMIERAKRIGVGAFISGAGNNVPGLKREAAVEAMVENLAACARVCERHGFTLLLEPFNTRVDHPDYFLDSPALAVEVLKAVNSPAAKMLFDIYHMQIMYGNITAFIRENLSWIGHFHVAGVPGRHEPDTGELNYPFILKEVDRLGYTGFFGLEYWPTVESGQSLARTRRHLA